MQNHYFIEQPWRETKAGKYVGFRIENVELWLGLRWMCWLVIITDDVKWWRCFSGWLRWPCSWCRYTAETWREYGDGCVQHQSKRWNRLDTSLCVRQVAWSDILQLLDDQQSQFAGSHYDRRPLLDHRTLLSSRHIPLQSVSHVLCTHWFCLRN